MRCDAENERWNLKIFLQLSFSLMIAVQLASRLSNSNVFQMGRDGETVLKPEQRAADFGNLLHVLRMC
jgi:hypothetical protein